MRKILYAIFGAGVVIRVLVFGVILSTDIPQLEKVAFGGDAVGYVQLATNLINKNVLGFSGHGPSAIRMPGYPVFLAFFYSLSGNWLYVQLTQIVLDLVTIYLVYKIATLITRESITPVLAAFFVALNPLIVASTVALLPETLNLCLLTLIAFMMIKYPEEKSTYLIVPVLLVLCIYLKPTNLLLTLMISAEYVIYTFNKFRFSKRFLISTALWLFILPVMLVPWWLRNFSVFNTFIPLTTSNGNNLYGGNNPQADGGYVSSDPYVMPELDEVASDRYFLGRATEWIRSNPGDFLALLPAKFARFFWPLSLGTSGSVDIPGFVFWAVLMAVISYFTLVLLGLWLLVVSKNYWQAIILLTPLVGLLIPSMIAFGAARFALPASTTLAVLAAMGAEKVSRMLRLH